jgi:hypothetical protein
MKLDKRIENERLIYTPFTTNKPKLHEKGYFTDDIHTFTDLENCDCRYGELVEHDDVDYAYPYCCESDDGCGDGGTTCDWFAFYIPESSLKQKEKQKQKQYRPYTFMEFNDIFTVGRPIKFRRKGMVGHERYLILNGYEHELDGLHDDQTITYAYIGAIPYTFNELFKNYEWQEHYTEDFKPFGVEE